MALAPELMSKGVSLGDAAQAILTYKAQASQSSHITPIDNSRPDAARMASLGRQLEEATQDRFARQRKAYPPWDTM
jgi:hypothetical protein